MGSVGLVGRSCLPQTSLSLDVTRFSASLAPVAWFSLPFSSRTTLATCLSFTNTLLAQTLCTYYKVPATATLAQPVSWYKSSPKHFEVCLKTLQFDRLWAKSDLILHGWHLCDLLVVTRGLWYNLHGGLTPFGHLSNDCCHSWHRYSAPFLFSELRLLR